LEAGAVRTRGARLAGHLTGGWQKFVGQRLN
jgi:lycopene beta-cyclase